FSQRVSTRAIKPRGLDEVFALAQAWNEMAERVEMQVRGQRELLANVSHELRSPLARVRVALELVPQTPENQARLADIALDLGELDRLIDDVLTASRLEAQGLPTHLESVDVAALFRSIVERAAHDPLVAGKEVRVKQSPAVTTIMADTALLRRALWNLVENAGKYGAPPIVLTAIPVERGVCLSVEDAGPGIPPELADRLFEPFARGARDRATAGFGLGLTIAKRVASVHGGTIALGRTLAGTRIDLTIPTL
ncbi:MAG: ATP-binding protein, partial [Myxococcota bacterium]